MIRFSHEIDFTAHNENNALRRRLDNLAAACVPLVDALTGREDVAERCWNPRAPVTLTLTVAEARGILTALDNAKGK